MITYNGSLAIDLNMVKSISIEYPEPIGSLVFELNNLIFLVENPQTERMELLYFPNEPATYYYDNSDSVHDYFEEWVGFRKDSKSS